MSDKIDYLDEDPVISSQKYCVVSVLTPKNFKQSVELDSKILDEVLPANELPLDASITIEQHNNVLKELAGAKTQLLRFKKEKEAEQQKITMYTFKVRGSYDTVEEAQKRITYLNSIDSNVNIYLAEVGKWCPFDDDPEKAKDAVYKDDELNRLMKGYKENQEKGKQLFEQRKADMVAKALQDTKDKKEKLKETDNRAPVKRDINVKMEDTLNEKEQELKDKEEKVKEGKKEVESKKGEIQSKEEKIRKLNDEMAAAKKKYEEMLAKTTLTADIK
jgi:hypothetical protein